MFGREVVKMEEEEVERKWRRERKVKVMDYVTNELGFYLMKWELS